METLLNEKELKLFFKYLIPNMAGALSLGILGFLDAAFIGRGVGTQGLTVLNIVIPLYTLYWSLGYLLGIGGATIASIDEGKKLNKA